MRTLAILVTVISIFVVAPHAAEPLSSRAIYVHDGDTIRVGDRAYRLVGFDAPETDRAKCAAERELGMRAKDRLQTIIDKGSNLELAEVVCSCSPGTHGTQFCNRARLCGTLKASGENVGAILIREHLAVRFIVATIVVPSEKAGVNLRRQSGAGAKMPQIG